MKLTSREKDIKSRRSYASFGEDCIEIEFTEACYGKLVISLSKFVIMRRKVKGMQEKCYIWHG